MERRIQDPAREGIFIVDRVQKTWAEGVDQMCEYMWRFLQLNRSERIRLRNHTERLSKILDWKTLFRNYFNGHREALRREYNYKLKPNSSYTDLQFLS